MSELRSDIASHPKKRRPFLFRLLLGTVSLSMTLAVIGGAGVAIWQGSTLLAERAEAAAPPEAAPPLPVGVERVHMEPGYRVERMLVGEVAPPQATDLSFELGGQIQEILVDEGAIVAKGDALARLDTALLHTDMARLDAARAALEADLTAAKRRFARQSELKARGFSPEEALDQAQAAVESLVARIAETDATRSAVAVRLDKAVLVAPYSGRVAARMTDTGATVAGGAPVLRLLETGAGEVRVGLPNWVEAVPGSVWSVEIDGKANAAVLTALRPDIDPATRTRTALLQLDDVEAPFGSLALVAVPREIVAEGSWIPRAALREGAPGVWTVLVIDDDDRARPAAIEILHAEADRLFVRGGLSEGAALVTGGPHRIVPGQHVAPLDES